MNTTVSHVITAIELRELNYTNPTQMMPHLSRKVAEILRNTSHNNEVTQAGIEESRTFIENETLPLKISDDPVDELTMTFSKDILRILKDYDDEIKEKKLNSTQNF